MKSGIIIDIDELKKLENKDIKNNEYNFLNENLSSFVDKIERDEINISEYIKGDIINVTKLSEEVFPTFTEIDFFISYSYKDAEIVNKLAVFLTNLGFKVFVDNQNWVSAYELLKKFDNKICLMKDGNYKYSKRNITTMNIYSMLSIALTKIISKSKYFILVGSENSATKNGDKYYTNSPWLEYEIEIFNLIISRDNIYKDQKIAITEAYAVESVKWVREYNLKEKYFSFLKKEDLYLLEKTEELTNKFEKIDKCLLKNYKVKEKVKSNFFRQELLGCYLKKY